MTVIVPVMSNAPRVPSPEEIQAIALAAVAHCRSVERRLLRLPVRGAVSDRIDAELVRRGYLSAEKDGYAT